MKFLILVLVFFFIGCTAEWDSAKVPQTNPYTHERESKYVYIPAQHQLPPIEIRRYGQ